MTKNAIAIREEKNKIQHAFKSMQGQFLEALPKHIDFNRFMRIALNAVTNTPKLLECDRGSFFLAVMRAAQLGLEPDGLMGQAYLIPYGNNVQLQVGYKGYIQLARQSGEISFITAECVYRNDDYDFNIFSTPRFSPLIGGDRGDLIGFIAVARFKDDTFQHVFMTVDEVNKIRDNSQAWKQALNDAQKDKDGNVIGFINKWNKPINSVPWFHHYEEMGKKTAIRRLSKYLPLSVQKADKVESLQEAGIKFDIKDGDIIQSEMQDITPENNEPDSNNVLDALESEITGKNSDEIDIESIYDKITNAETVKAVEQIEKKYKSHSEKTSIIAACGARKESLNEQLSR